MTQLQTNKDLEKQRDQELLQKFKDKNSTILLYNIDYRDSYSENPEILEGIAQTGYTEEDALDYYNTRESIDYMIDDTYDGEELEYVKENLIEDIQEYCYDNDKSDPIRDLVQNTKECLFLVDLDFYFEDPTYLDEDEYKEYIIDFLEKINQEPTEELIKKVWMIAREAVYGGNAYAGLYADPCDFYGNNKPNIEINDLHLIILNHGNGSGWHDDIGNIKSIVVPRKNIHNDDTVDYSFREVYGYDGNDCISSFDFTDKKATIGENTEAEELAEQEKKWKEKYLTKGCGGADCTKFKYHKMYYKNDYPTGNKCEICGRFFVN